VEVTSNGDDPGAFDRCVLSYTLPHLFGVDVPEDVARPPYLLATGPRFRALPGALRVGIRWAGDRAHYQDRMRSTDLSAWAPVLSVPGVTFYNLQLGRTSEQLRPYDSRIHDLAPELTDWARTAAVMMELDLVISVDTSVAHLAGALGLPVWICLSATPEWRWMLERPDTPWYDSARLFRQRRAGEWPALFEQVAAALRELIQQREVEAA
jgi:hypothetical protein